MSKSEKKETDALNYFKCLQEKSDKCDRYEKALGKLSDFESMVDRVWSKSVSISDASKFTGLDERTILGYMKKGLIPKHPESTDGKILIRIPDLLMIDKQYYRSQVSRKIIDLSVGYDDMSLNF